MDTTPIHVYAPNLVKRTDRKASIMAQFAGREEFELHVVPAIEHNSGAWGLWQTFLSIVSEEAEKDTPFFVFCEDDHQFTPDYTPEFLHSAIGKADALGADVLSGGMSWFDNPVQVDEILFWVKAFNGMQFTVFFRRFYKTLLACTPEEEHVTDSFLSSLTDNIFVMYPYISTQADFGYSDATAKNNRKGRVPALFMNTHRQLHAFNKVRRFYSQPGFDDIPSLKSTDDIVLPTYVINLPCRTDRKESIRVQFAGRSEFDVHIVEACVHARGNVGLWQSICKIVADAERNGKDIILLCEDDHVFTQDYSRSAFLRQVYDAGMMGTDILLGGVGGFGNIVPVRNCLFWIDWFWCTQFAVIYRRAFSRILNADFKETDVADEFLSRLLTNKLAIFPLVSVQREFGYSDVTESNKRYGILTRCFKSSKRKAEVYMRTAAKYGVMRNDTVFCDNEIMSVLRTMPVKALHIGCGSNILEGWVNTDIKAGDTVAYLDAAAPFPLPNRTLDYIFSEHMFEHMPYEKGKRMLEECYRTLKPGGVLRLTMPTLDFLVRLYNEPDNELHQQYAHWSLQQYAPQMYADFMLERRKLPMALVVNNFMRFWGHRMIYNFSLLRSMLENIGFEDIKECVAGYSEHPYLRGLEHHGDVIPKWANELESMTVEAVKGIE